MLLAPVANDAAARSGIRTALRARSSRDGDD
jgi:hypothetical protein